MYFINLITLIEELKIAYKFVTVFECVSDCG